VIDQVDGIVVGGGHNGLITAAYLARCGVQMAVLEAEHHLGGGLSTEEVTLPGFRHNLHAFFVRWTPDYTIWDDLDLDRYGVRSIWPEVQNGLPFDGGERALVTYRDLGRSLDEIRRISPTDADNYQRLHHEFSELVTRIEVPLRFAPPMEPDRLEELLSVSPVGRRYLELTHRSALDVVCDAFESEPVRALVLFNVSVRGYLPVLDVPGTGPIVALALPNSHEGRIIAGGTAEAARALAAAVSDAGGVVSSGQRVVRIEVEGGRASGVVLEDGRRIRARRFVVSSVPAAITLREMVEEPLEPELDSALAGYRWLEEALFGVHWALEERPRFRAEAYAPDLPRALNLALGYETSRDLVDHMHAVRSAVNTPHGAIHSSIPTIHDPSQAPPGRHTSFGWHFVPGPPMRGRWDSEATAERREAIVSTYRHYAPNLDSITLEIATHTPDDTERYNQAMRGGDRHHGSYHPDNWGVRRSHLGGYRTPIEGLYLCGSSQHPGGSFTGQPGYNAAGVIAEDLGLDRWWPRLDLQL
jgi:phytoene dehydrogenase-like protein